jgi:C4-dicarboxylate-specific signal transduction histidine kinase
VNQPIAASLTNARTCLRWLDGDTPNVEEARKAAMRIVQDQTRAAEIISRIRLLFKKDTAQRELVDINEIIREMIVLLHGETTRYLITLRTKLAEDLPQVMGDRVQLQQVMMNLTMNGIDAMTDVDGTRELVINSQPAADGHRTAYLMLSIRPNPMAPVWDYGSAAPLLSPMEAAYGRARILREAQAFTSRYPQSRRRRIPLDPNSRNTNV